MVDSIRPPYRNVPPKMTSEPVKKSSPTETHNDEKSAQPYVVTKERRKSRDRRNPNRRARPVYDMRSGRRGRRKEDFTGANISTKA